ncbi:MAG: BatD family protein [Sulfuricurvum sp.]|uniref:BatD family protein n=1 Tax=Sulfuricurvum sp. TaxID=2025608 RepID=UPI002635261C|nr:BatD family protein [Sulfuricurvum sp.]MDD2784878.1 BatD family protein [Sulfuricurvum sp.]
MKPIMPFVGRILFLFLMSIELFGAKAYLLQNPVEVGESATLVISAKGNKMHFPKIEAIGGFAVVSHQSRQSMQLMNGALSRQLDNYYTFYPDKDVHIPSFEITIDGKKEQTEMLELNMQASSAKPVGHHVFSLEMNVSNDSPLQQEGVKLTFVFKRDRTENLVDMKFSKPVLEGFWVKEGEKDTPYVEDNYIIHTISYYIFPQRSGEILIPKAKIDIAKQVNSREIFLSQIQWKSIFSNELTLHVSPLIGATLLGHFNVEVQVDATEVEINNAVNVTVKIVGDGNFEDIAPFVLQAQGATIFSDEPKIKTFLQSDILKGEFIQKFSLSAQKSFRIEPIKLHFYNPDTKKIEYFTSKPVDIKILHPERAEKSSRGVSEPVTALVEQPSFRFEWVNIGIGLCLGMLLFGLVRWVFHYEKKGKMRFVGERELLQKLLKYKGKNEEATHLITLLEENIYGNAKHKLSKRVIKKFLKNLV